MRIKSAFLMTFLMLLIGVTSCNTTSPDKFFQITILNLNVIRDFSSEEMTRNLELYAKEFEGHKRKGFEAQDYIETKVSYIKQTIKRINTVTPRDKEEKVIKEKSLELFNYVLPVYENEYMNVAKLCDAKESEENIKQLANDIEEKYGEKFSKKHEQLFEFAKSYVNKHNLNVKFDWTNHK